MAADGGYGPVPTNQILVAGQPLIQILKVKTNANCYPGRLVMKDTTDGQIKVSDGTQFIGWLGYEQTIKKYRPTNVNTAYVANDHAAVLNGGKFVIVANGAAGIAVAKGQLLKAVAGGQVSGGTAGSDHIVAIAEESKSSAAATDIMVRSLL
jgi:hypothetical protein